jgi:hypothetical protein
MKLYGKITVKRISGSINVVPTSGSPPLQGKVVIPTHSEQLVKPDEEYYGLSTVTVAAVPKVPAAETRVIFDGNNIVRTQAITIGATPVVTVAEDRDPYYYNYEQFPEIPEDVKKWYPYFVIVRTGTTTRLYASEQKFYYLMEADWDRFVRSQSGVGNIRYTLNTDVNQWILEYVSETYWSLEISDIWDDGTYHILWSNHDIANGSPEATEIYFRASVPAVDQPTSIPTHYYYAGLRLPALPAEISEETYPYRLIVREIETGYLCGVISSTLPKYRKDALKTGYLSFSANYTYRWDPGSDTWVSYNTGSTLYMDEWGCEWTNCRMSASGSGYNGDYYGYPVPLVPDPV